MKRRAACLVLAGALLGGCNLLTGADSLEVGEGGASAGTGTASGPSTGPGTGAGTCGDATCGAGEDCASCAADCGPCSATCDDGACTSDETCVSCPTDCGACAPTCGDGTCAPTETCEACPGDCGACGPSCGDGTCDAVETCASCASDCGACDTCQGASDETTTLDAEEQAFLVLINQYRADNGRGPLTGCVSMHRAAQGHSEDMRDQNYFSHTGLNGSSPWDRACDACYELGCGPATAMAENIAAGNSGAAGTFEQWRNSPGHNANMLGADFTQIGIGRATGGGTYGTYWTNVFGGDSEPSCN